MQDSMQGSMQVKILVYCGKYSRNSYLSMPLQMEMMPYIHHIDEAMLLFDSRG